MSQSGGVGVALAGQLSRLGVGISSFASVGSKLDVSGNDMLMWWEHDDVTRLAVLYLESFGNPRKFARTARRVGATLPVLTGHPASNGQSSADQALFEQAGVIATDSFGELVTGFLHREPGGGWLPPDKTADLLPCYGIWSTPNRLRAKTRPSRPPGRWSRLSPAAPR